MTEEQKVRAISDSAGDDGTSSHSMRATLTDSRAITVQEALTRAGGFGKFQCLVLLTMILGNNCAGLIVYGVAYYEFDPPYICTYDQPQFEGHAPDGTPQVADGIWRKLMAENGNIQPFLYTTDCDRETVCAMGDDENTSLIGYKIDSDSLYYIQNWVEQLNMYCISKSYVGFLGAFAFLGAALSCFFVPALGDKYGRYTVWIVTIFCQLPLYFMANLTSNIGVIYVACFYLGMGLIGRFACGFVLLTELMPAKHQAMAGTAAMVGDVVATLYITIFIRFISNDCSILIWVGLGLNCAAIISGYFIVESPEWLMSIGDKQGAMKALYTVAKINGVKDFEIHDLKAAKFETIDPEKKAANGDDAPQFGNKDTEIEAEVTEGKKLLSNTEPSERVVAPEEQAQYNDGKVEKPIGFCQDKALLVNLILMTIFWTVSSFNYYIMTFYLKYIPGSVYLNTSLSCIAEIIAYIGSGLVMNTFGVKLSFIISFILAGAGGILLVIFFQADGYLIGVFVLFAKFGISFAFNIAYLATPQMFPIALCSTAFGICNIFARFSTVLSPLIAELPDPVPMSIFSISCISAAFLPLFLRKVEKSN